jgi:single-strand DNA-binding protein
MGFFDEIYLICEIFITTKKMRGLNKVTLIGNLGNDPNIQTLEGNIKVAKFSLATSENYKDSNGQNQTSTDWHNIVLWRGLADLAQNYLRKGSLVYVEGKLKTRSYDDKDGQKKYVTEIVADNILLLDKKEIEMPQ